MRSDRLLAIMLLLQTRGQLPASELAERLEVSIRTIMRDVEALSSAGVPVYTVRGPHGGVALLPDYRTDVSGLTADESRALFVMLSGSAHTDLGLGSALAAALRKVLAALPAPHRPGADLTSQRILIDPTRWGEDAGARPPDPHLNAFQQAVFTDRRLRVRYRHGRDRRERTYTLDPYGLVNKAGVWYLVADHDGQPHLFRADRTRSATVLSEAVTRRDGHKLTDLWDTLRRDIDDLPTPIAVTARIRDDSLALFRRVHHADLVATDPGGTRPAREPRPGWTTVRLRFRSLAGTQPLLAFGPDIEILAPKNVRQHLYDMASATVASYDGCPEGPAPASNPARVSSPAGRDPRTPNR